MAHPASTEVDRFASNPRKHGNQGDSVGLGIISQSAKSNENRKRVKSIFVGVLAGFPYFISAGVFGRPRLHVKLR